MADFLDALQDALTAAGIPGSVPIVGPFSTDQVEWSATVSIFDEQFNDAAAVRRAFESLGVTVEWIHHALYSRFNRTAGGTDEGGGKTWDVIFVAGDAEVVATATGFSAGDMADAAAKGFERGRQGRDLARLEQLGFRRQPVALATGQLWRDVDGHARICGVVPVEKVLYAVLLRTRGAGGRKRRPFLFPVESLLRGDDGWTLVKEVRHG